MDKVANRADVLGRRNLAHSPPNRPPFAGNNEVRGCGPSGRVWSEKIIQREVVGQQNYRSRRDYSPFVAKCLLNISNLSSASASIRSASSAVA